MADTLPTLRIDWDGSTGLAQAGADVSARLLALEWGRGRDFASQLVGKSNEGSLVALVNNNSEDYSPDNTSSPLTGNLEPDTSQKVRLTLDGRAAQFTSANSESLSIADNASLSTGDIDFTIACWVYLDAIGSDRTLMAKFLVTGNQREYRLFYDHSSLRFRFAVSGDGTSGTLTNIDADNFGAPSINTWYFIVCQHDASGNTISIQVNNGTADSAAHSAGLTDGTAAFYLGSHNTGAAPLLDGREVSVMFTKKVTTAAENTFLYHDGDGVQYLDIGLTGDGSALKTSLEAWWDLQEESGTRVDSHGSNNLTDNNTVTAAAGIPNFTMWSGFLKSIEPLPSTSGLNAARLVATGPLGAVNLNKIRLAMATSEVTGTAIGRILTEANWPAADRTVDAGKTTMTRFWLENEVRVINALRRVEITESGFIGESKDGRIFFEDRRHRQLSPHTISQATFTDANGGALVYSPPLRRLNSQQQLFHIFTVGIQTWTVGSLATLWTLSASGSNSPAILPGETLTFWAEYPNPASAVDAFAVDAWTTPVENTDYEANSQAGGGGSDMSGDLSLTITKFGNSMKIAITNDHATDTAFLTLLQGRGTPITKDDPARITVEKSATNPRTFPNPPEYLPSVSEAKDWADWHSNVFGVSQPLLEMTLIGNRSEAQMKKVLGLDISDRFTFVGTNDSGLGINEDFFIESQRYSMDTRTKLIRATWAIAAASAGMAWTLDVSPLEAETRLAYGAS